MLYCGGCGREVSDDASFCANCGRSLKQPSKTGQGVTTTVEQQAEQTDYSQSKVAAGVLFGLLVVIGSVILLFLSWLIGLVLMLVFAAVGLIVGTHSYPENTVARKTFMKGWGITVGVTAGVTVLFLLLAFAIGFSIASSMF